MMLNMNREVLEGWTPVDFIRTLELGIANIMAGNSWRKPFRTEYELCEWIRSHQPYYKKKIVEVDEHFLLKYNLKGVK